MTVTQNPQEERIRAQWMAANFSGLARIQMSKARDAEREATAVAELRRLGVSWDRLGEALGISRQAAIKRHGAAGTAAGDRSRVDPPPRLRTGPVRSPRTASGS